MSLQNDASNPKITQPFSSSSTNPQSRGTIIQFLPGGSVLYVKPSVKFFDAKSGSFSVPLCRFACDEVDGMPIPFVTKVPDQC
jgi:hypothetical protein